MSDGPHCRCFRGSRSVAFHTDRQDTASAGWRHLSALIDEAAADGRPVFKPFTELSPDERREVVTLPPSIARLTEVRHLLLYGTHLVRIPPEIGAMTSLEIFEPYTSRRLHWFPYELTRCTRLRSSTVSTRALYGNDKFRSPFPRLTSPAPAEGACSVCRSPIIGETHRVWISLRVATDVLPLLVNACSPACVAALPAPADGYVRTPHTGGPDLVQPA